MFEANEFQSQQVKERGAALANAWMGASESAPVPLEPDPDGRLASVPYKTSLFI